MSTKNTDHRGRWRNQTVAFHVTPEEKDAINTRAQLSGLIRQEYLIQRALAQDIVVVGNPRVHKALKHQMEQILVELQRIGQGETVDQDLQETIRIVAATFDGMKQ